MKTTYSPLVALLALACALFVSGCVNAGYRTSVKDLPGEKVKDQRLYFHLLSEPADWDDSSQALTASPCQQPVTYVDPATGLPVWETPTTRAAAPNPSFWFFWGYNGFGQPVYVWRSRPVYRQQPQIRYYYRGQPSERRERPSQWRPRCYYPNQQSRPQPRTPPPQRYGPPPHAPDGK